MQKYLACGATSKRYLHVSEIDDKVDVLGAGLRFAHITRPRTSILSKTESFGTKQGSRLALTKGWCSNSLHRSHFCLVTQRSSPAKTGEEHGVTRQKRLRGRLTLQRPSLNPISFCGTK